MVRRGVAGGGGAWRAGLWIRSDGARKKKNETQQFTQNPTRHVQPCSRFLKPFSRSSFLCFVHLIFFFSFRLQIEERRREGTVMLSDSEATV